MANPIFYTEEPAASSCALVGDDPSERRGWGVARPLDGESAVFPTRGQAEDHARRHGHFDVEVDVIIGQAPG